MGAHDARQMNLVLEQPLKDCFGTLLPALVWFRQAAGVSPFPNVGVRSPVAVMDGMGRTGLHAGKQCPGHAGVCWYARERLGVAWRLEGHWSTQKGGLSVVKLRNYFDACFQFDGSQKGTNHGAAF